MLESVTIGVIRVIRVQKRIDELQTLAGFR